MAAKDIVHSGAVQRATAGTVGGLAGGGLMTVMMTQIAPRLVPSRVLPDVPAPVLVVDRAEQVLGVGLESEALEKSVALGGHLLYSAASGSLYALVDRALSGRSGAIVPLRGAAYGLLVWAMSFEALLPQLQVMPRNDAGPDEDVAGAAVRARRLRSCHCCRHPSVGEAPVPVTHSCCTNACQG